MPFLRLLIAAGNNNLETLVASQYEADVSF